MSKQDYITIAEGIKGAFEGKPYHVPLMKLSDFKKVIELLK